MHLSLSVHLAAAITGGSIEVKLKWGFVQVLDQKVDLCDTLKDAKLECPLAAGSYTVSQGAAIPGEAPKVSKFVQYKNFVEALLFGCTRLGRVW